MIWICKKCNDIKITEDNVALKTCSKCNGLMKKVEKIEVKNK